jgi:hypothetical protein
MVVTDLYLPWVPAGVVSSRRQKKRILTCIDVSARSPITMTR